MCERLNFSTYDLVIEPGIKGLNIFLESFYPFKPNILFIKNQSTDSNRKLINLSCIIRTVTVNKQVTQQTITCSNSILETLETVAKYVQS